MKNPNVGFEETQHLGFIFLKHPTKFDEEVAGDMARDVGRH